MQFGVDAGNPYPGEGRIMKDDSCRCRRVLTFLFAALLVVQALPAARPAKKPPSLDLPSITVGEHVFHRRLLGNGLRAVAAADGEETVSVFLVIGAGKRQETPATTGLAHLTEHAMYTGTARTGPGAHDARIKEMGGSSNAFTREDYTLFYDHAVPAGRLAEVLAMEADRLRGIVFDKEAFLVERERLAKEESTTHQPDLARGELVESFVFLVHPYGAGVPDREGHTRAPHLGLEEVRRFYDLYYRPDLTSVVVAGGVEPGTALDAVEEAFGALKRGPARPAVPQEPRDGRGGRFHFDWEHSQDRVEHVWIVPPLGHADRPTLDVLARLLSRRALSDASPVRADMGDRADEDLFRIAANGPRAGAELVELMEDVRGGMMDPEEVEKVKALLRDDFTAWSLRGRPYFSLAGTFGVYEVLGHPGIPAHYEEAIDGVTRERLQRVANRRLSPGMRYAVLFAGSGQPPPPLPEDRGELQQAAQDAASAGDLDRAVAAYTRLLEGKPSKMYTVIFLASRGQVRVEQKDYDAAIADFEQALQVVDYPAVRDLLEEAQGLRYGVVREPIAVVAEAAPAASPHGGSAGHGGMRAAPAGRPPAMSGPHPTAPQRQAPATKAAGQARIASAAHPSSVGGPHRSARAREESRGAGKEGYRRRVELGVPGRVLEDAILGREKIVRVLEGHSGTGYRAEELASLVEADRYRLTDIGAGRLREHWDLLFGDERAVKSFLDAARWPLQREGWEVGRKGDFVRLQRAARREGPVGPAPPSARIERAVEEREVEVEKRERTRSRGKPNPLAQLSVPGRVLEDTSRGPEALVPILERHAATRDRAEELAAQVVGDRYREVDIGSGRTMLHWDLRLVDGVSAKAFLDAARWPLQREGWSVARQGRILRLQMRAD